MQTNVNKVLRNTILLKNRLPKSPRKDVSIFIHTRNIDDNQNSQLYFLTDKPRPFDKIGQTESVNEVQKDGPQPA